MRIVMSGSFSLGGVISGLIPESNGGCTAREVGVRPVAGQRPVCQIPYNNQNNCFPKRGLSHRNGQLRLLSQRQESECDAAFYPPTEGWSMNSAFGNLGRIFGRI